MAPCSKERRQGEVELPLRPETVPEPKQLPQSSFENTKSSIHLDLGSYKAAITPMSILILTAAWLGSIMDFRHHQGLTGQAIFCGAICALYIMTSVVWGPRFMKNRDPIKPKRFMMVYNAFQVIFCSNILYKLIVSGWVLNWQCQPNDLSDSPQVRMVTTAVHLYFWSKVLDFTDTFFIILNKKWDHLSLLHIIHHSGMCLITFCLSMSMPVCHQTFTAYINSTVHIVMYSYYFLAAMGPAVQRYLWWKRYITRMQLTQFVIVLYHNLQVFFNGCTGVSKGIAGLFVFYSVAFFALFADFYLKEYRKKAVRSNAAKSQGYKTTSLKCD